MILDSSTIDAAERNLLLEHHDELGLWCRSTDEVAVPAAFGRCPGFQPSLPSRLEDLLRQSSEEEWTKCPLNFRQTALPAVKILLAVLGSDHLMDADEN